MRGFLADIALNLSKNASDRADRHSGERWLHFMWQADFWEDVRLWLSGLGDWQSLRVASEVRHHRRQRKIMRAGWPS